MTATVTAEEILTELKGLGNESHKKTFLRHGAKEPFFGVPIEELKKIQKRIKKDYQLALDLYATGISDAQYLAGLIADDARMTKKDLERWLKQATWHMISEFIVPWVAAGSPAGHDLALKWIDSKDEATSSAGWVTLAGIVSVKDDADLDLDELKKLLDRVEKTIHDQPNRTRYNMNGFVIAVGSYVKSLTTKAKQVGKKIGHVEWDAGDTSCKLPAAVEYIEKVEKRGSIGKKRKTAKCM